MNADRSSHGSGGAVRHLLGDNLRQFGMAFALIVLIGFFQFKTHRVLTSTNLINLLSGNAYILVLAIGMVLVIIAGHIDLSVGSVAAFVGIVVAMAMRDWGFNWFEGILLGLALGALIGVWQGFWVAVVGIPAFITTLAGMMIFRGANQLVGKSNSITVNDTFQQIGNGYLPEIGPETGFNNLTVLLGLVAVAALVLLGLWRRIQLSRLGSALEPVWLFIVKNTLLASVLLYLTYMFATGRRGTAFPIPGLILVALVIIYSFLAGRTVWGRHIYAVGGNKQAAQLSGVRTTRINFLVMMNMSILAGLAGMMFVARSTASGPFDGTGWELDAIAAVFIGGAAVSGGVGTVVGSIIGGLVMAVLNNGLQLMGVGNDMTQIIKGLVLLVAVAFDVLSKKQGRPSIIGAMQRSLSGMLGRTTPASANGATSLSPTETPDPPTRREATSTGTPPQA